MTGGKQTVIAYNALSQAKIDIGQRFQTMADNMKNQMNEVVEMNQSSWQGSSSNFFLEVFEENKNVIDKERINFDNVMGDLLSNMYDTFTTEEQAQIQNAKKVS